MNELEYKGFSIVGDGTFGYKSIKPIGKGSVALELRGIFTNYSFAKQAIDAYVSKKGGTDDKANKSD